MHCAPVAISMFHTGHCALCTCDTSPCSILVSVPLWQSPCSILVTVHCAPVVHLHVPYWSVCPCGNLHVPYWSLCIVHLWYISMFHIGQCAPVAISMFHTGHCALCTCGTSPCSILDSVSLFFSLLFPAGVLGVTLFCDSVAYRLCDRCLSNH